MQGHTARADKVALTNGFPEVIRVENGPEFTAKALDKWAYENGVRLDFIRSGKPVENVFIGRCNASLRKECLNFHCFQTIEEVKQRIEQWRKEYSGYRPHSSLCNLTSAEYVLKHKTERTSETENVILQVIKKSGAGQDQAV